jgi:hypothetical protein
MDGDAATHEELAMTTNPPTPPTPPEATAEDVAYVAAHLPEIRRRVAGNEILYFWIAGTLILGLIANVVGFLWSTVASGTADALVSQLLLSVGTALWTGSVLVLLLEVLPDIQRRYAIRALRKYERQIEEQHLPTPDPPTDERDT